MHYRGTLASDGTQFDASYDRGTPLDFEVGRGMVIRGYVLDGGLLIFFSNLLIFCSLFWFFVAEGRGEWIIFCGFLLCAFPKRSVEGI